MSITNITAYGFLKAGFQGATNGWSPFFCEGVGPAAIMTHPCPGKWHLLRLLVLFWPPFFFLGILLWIPLPDPKLCFPRIFFTHLLWSLILQCLLGNPINEWAPVISPEVSYAPWKLHTCKMIYNLSSSPACLCWKSFLSISKSPDSSPIVPEQWASVCLSRFLLTIPLLLSSTTHIPTLRPHSSFCLAWSNPLHLDNTYL